MGHNVTRYSEMTKSYKLYSGIIMGSSILGTWLLPKTTQTARGSTVPLLYPADDSISVSLQLLSSLGLAGRKDHATKRKTRFCIIAQV